MYEYLKTLPLTDDQKNKINEQGYENAPTLYALCKAFAAMVKDWLELDNLDALEAALWEMMSAEERAEMQAELDTLKDS